MSARSERKQRERITARMIAHGFRPRFTQPSFSDEDNLATVISVREQQYQEMTPAARAGTRAKGIRRRLSENRMGPQEETVETVAGWTAEQIKAMTMDEYIQHREVLLRTVAKQVPDPTMTTCMWCAKPFHKDVVDAHEDECGAA